MSEPYEQSEPFESHETPEAKANAAWSRLLQGNRRFAEGTAEHPWQDRETRERLLDGQHPDAAVLSCADSRVPPEIIFDQGLGDLFDIRTAGEVLDDAVIASLEYAVEHLGVSLIVVLGHEGCGAVKAAVDGVAELATRFDDCDCFDVPEGAARADAHADHLEALLAAQDSPIVREVGASVAQAMDADLEDAADFERTHVARTIELLVDGSEVIRLALAEGRLMIAGARYVMHDGLVEVLSF